MAPRDWASATGGGGGGGGCLLGSGRVMAEGGGRPRWGVDMLFVVMLAGSEVTRGESTRGSSDAQGVDCVLRQKSWEGRPPMSSFGGCGMVSNMDIGKLARQHVTGGGRVRWRWAGR